MMPLSKSAMLEATRLTREGKLTEAMAVLQGSAYGVPTHFRMSFATSEERLADGIRRIGAAVASLSA